MRTFEGIIPPMVTPLDADEDLDVDTLRRESRLFAAAGVHGLSYGGSTGEGAVLHDSEIARGVEVVQTENDGKLPLLCGIIRNSTREAISAAREARAAGADGLMVTPVHYFGASDDGNVEFYQRLSDVGLPIIVYNVVPKSPVSPELMVRLAGIPNVYGIKQSIGGVHALADMVAAVPEHIRVFGAHDDLLMDDYILGAAGAISAILSLFPALFVEQWNAVQRGDVSRAREIHYRVLPVWRSIEGAYFPARIKAALAMIGRAVGPARHPMIAPNTRDLETIRSRLEAAGFPTKEYRRA